MLNSYLNQQETKEEFFERLKALGVTEESLNYFCFSSPIMKSFGTNHQNLYACAILEPKDTLDSITKMLKNAIDLVSSGAGLSVYLGNIRPIGSFAGGSEQIKTDGILPIITMLDSLVTAIKQQHFRDGAGVVWLPIDHFEILDFFSLIDETHPRPHITPLKTLHTGIVITPSFLYALENDLDFQLQLPLQYRAKYPSDVRMSSSKTSIKARVLFKRLQTVMVKKGHPFIFFRNHESDVTCPNLCCEVLLPTSKDEMALCSLATVNLLPFCLDLKTSKDSEERCFTQKIDWIKVTSSQKLQEEEALLRWNRDGLRNVVLDLIQTLRRLRSIDEYQPSYAPLKKLDVGVGFMGIIDIVNILILTTLSSPEKPLCGRNILGGEEIIGLLKANIFDFFKIFLDILSSIKQLYPNERIFAIAPNVYTSLITGVSNGIMPRKAPVYTKRLKGKEFKLECPCLNHPMFLEGKKFLFYETTMFEDFSCSKISETKQEFLWRLVGEFYKVIDQGISFSRYVQHTTLTNSDIFEKTEIQTFLSLSKKVKTIYYTHVVDTVNLTVNSNCNFCESCSL